MITVLTALICLSGYQFWKISNQYAQEARIKAAMSAYSPEKPDDSAGFFGVAEGIGSDSSDVPGELPPVIEPAAEEPVIVNPFIVEMQSEVNSAIMGWLTIPNTKIDYPFIASEDHQYYLGHDIYENPSKAGSIFMDYRCPGDFTALPTILYGHNMKNGSMFGELRLFADADFFNTNPDGSLRLKDVTYTLTCFAYMVVKADDPDIFYFNGDRETFFDYVKETARNYREPDRQGKVVALSTCAYEFDEARMVVLATATPVPVEAP